MVEAFPSRILSFWVFMSAATAETFGTQVYLELRKISGFDIMTQTLNYEAIQKLKNADRATTLRLFRGVGISILSDQELSPTDVARSVTLEARNRKTIDPSLVVADIVIQILSGLAALA